MFSRFEAARNCTEFVSQIQIWQMIYLVADVQELIHLFHVGSVKKDEWFDLWVHVGFSDILNWFTMCNAQIFILSCIRNNCLFTFTGLGPPACRLTPLTPSCTVCARRRTGSHYDAIRSISFQAGSFKGECVRLQGERKDLWKWSAWDLSGAKRSIEAWRVNASRAYLVTRASWCSKRVL